MYDYPKKTLEFIIENEGDEKKYEIKFPNTGKLLSIQSLKASLLKGQLGSILEGNTSSGDYVAILADMIASLTIVCPQIITDMNVNSISELDAVDSAKLLKVYIEQYLPWYNEWSIILRNGGIPLIKKEENIENIYKEPLNPEKKKSKPVISAE